MTDVDKLKDAIAAAGLTQRRPPIETVTEEDGVAVFRNKSGAVIGGMNWVDYTELMAKLEEQDSLKSDQDATVQKGKT